MKNNLALVIFTLCLSGQILFSQTVSDNFDPNLDGAIWESFSGTVEANTNGQNAGSGSSGNSLWFGGTGLRFATTVPIDTSNGGSVRFLFAMAGAENSISSVWENADSNEEMVVEYSTDGGSSFTQMGGPYDNTTWQTIAIPIPSAAQTSETQFRFRQLRNSGSCCDHWAIDDLVIDGSGPGSNLPPIANAGSNIVVFDQDNDGSEVIQLNGSSSSDVDGSIVGYEWRYDLGGFQFIYGETQQVTLPIGNYAIRLKVTDNSGATSTDFVSVGVRPATFTVNFNLDGKGTRTGGGALGQSVEINNAAAEPVVSGNPGWIFDGWDVSFDDITSNLTVTAQYLVDVDNTQPDQDVEIDEERTGGSSSDLATTFEANSLSLGDGADFNLGPNEILDLNGGDLVIEEGAVFSGNGTILGNVFNSGLLRIPVVKVGMVLPQISNEGFVAIERPERTKAPAKVEAPIDNGGTFSTDASLEVTGTFTQTATGTLRLFAEGEEAGVSFSQLIVGDTVTLDGEIQLVLDQAEYGLFTLNPGDTFDVVVINPDVTGKVITLQPGLGYRILATAAIQSQADIAALSPTAYVPTQANDPDVLVELPSGLFTFTLVENDTVLRATYQGSTPLPTPTTGDTEITSLIPSIDTDPASDSWETQNGFDPAVNDMLTRDSDGDGDSDIRELFQGTGKNSGGEQFGFKGSQGNPATQTLSTQFRRSTESTVMDEIEGVNQWSTDLVNWYESGESNGNVVVTFSEQPTDMGTYEIVDVDVTVTNGQTPKLYYRLDLRAKE